MRRRPHPAGVPHAEWAVATSHPEKETKGKDQYLPKKKRTKTYGIIILRIQCEAFIKTNKRDCHRSRQKSA